VSIQIIWQNEISGPLTQETIVLPHAELVLSMAGNVIVESSWAPSNASRSGVETGLIQQLRYFLLSPVAQTLQVTLYKQGTDYSQKIWQSLLTIPFGQVVSYSDLADRLNSGPRAVAQACRANPYAGIIPCHRVVAKSGLGGFMGQSQGPFVVLKQQLLAYERQGLEHFH